MGRGGGRAARAIPPWSCFAKVHDCRHKYNFWEIVALIVRA